MITEAQQLSKLSLASTFTDRLKVTWFYRNVDIKYNLLKVSIYSGVINYKGTLKNHQHQNTISLKIKVNKSLFFLENINFQECKIFLINLWSTEQSFYAIFRKFLSCCYYLLELLSNSAGSNILQTLHELKKYFIAYHMRIYARMTPIYLS